MMSSIAPFLVNKLGPFVEQPKGRKKISMTLVAALSGFEGIVLFGDTEETAAEYAKKTIEKVAVYDFQDHPFRFAIGNATNEGNYADALQNEIAGRLLSFDKYDLGGIHSALTNDLTRFYSQHIWPRAANQPQTQYLLVLQPLPKGDLQIIYISETAVNFVAVHYKTIGVGSYFADYLFNLALCGGDTDSLNTLLTASVYVAREVRENIAGVGPIRQIAVFMRNGEWDYVTHDDILQLEKNIEPMHEALRRAFYVATDSWIQDEDSLSEMNNTLEGIRNQQIEWYGNWEGGRAQRKSCLPFVANRRSSGSVL